MALKSKTAQLHSKHARHHIKSADILLNRPQIKRPLQQIDITKNDWSTKMK